MTSVNCLLEDGLLLSPTDFRVYVAPFQLSAGLENSRLYTLSDTITHEFYTFYLDSNIAALKLTKDIEFNDYVQPICLPENNSPMQRKTATVC